MANTKKRKPVVKSINRNLDTIRRTGKKHELMQKFNFENSIIYDIKLQK